MWGGTRMGWGEAKMSKPISVPHRSWDEENLLRVKWGGAGQNCHPHSLLFRPIWEERIWWAKEEFISFIFLSFTPILPNQTKEFISFPFFSFLFFPNLS